MSTNSGETSYSTSVDVSQNSGYQLPMRLDSVYNVVMYDCGIEYTGVGGIFGQFTMSLLYSKR